MRASCEWCPANQDDTNRLAELTSLGEKLMKLRERRPMNPRIVTLVIGIVSTVFGIGGLISPTFVMERVVGFAVDPAFSENFVRGEVRAVYGGMFTVLGVATLLAAMDVYAHRARILLIGLLWLGLCGGRLISVVVDGSPGLFGWLSAAFELVVGGLLVASATMARSAGVGGEPDSPG